MVIEPEDTEARKYPQRLTDSKIEKWVYEALGRYRVLAGINIHMHWSGQLTAILMRLDYTPKFELLANQDRFAHDSEGHPEIPSHVDLIRRHISQELLDDLDATIELADAVHKVEVLTMTDVNGQPIEGAIYVAENGTMSYTDHEDQAEMDKADKDPSWGSW